MAITKDKKVAITKGLADIMKDAKSIVFASFDGLGVEDTTVLRKELGQDAVSYRVVKKTLLRRVLDENKIEGNMPHLEGNIAIAWSGDDLTAPARGVYAFHKKEHEHHICIVGGIFEGRYMNADEMNEIATIPSMQVLRGMFVNVINSPIQGFVSVLNQIAEKKG